MEPLALILRVVVAISAVGIAQCASSHSAPAPSVDCSSLVLTMADCLSFVSNGSTISKPEGTCCSGLKTVLKTDAECLCEAYKSSAQLGVVLNVTKALSLPAACDVSATSASKCQLSITPASAPVESLSPESSPAVDIAAPPTTAETAPSTTAETAGEPAPAPALGIGSSGSPLVTVSIGCLAASLAVTSFLF